MRAAAASLWEAVNQLAISIAQIDGSPRSGQLRRFDLKTAPDSDPAAEFERFQLVIPVLVADGTNRREQRVDLCDINAECCSESATGVGLRCKFSRNTPKGSGS